MQSPIAQTGMQLQSKTFLGRLEYHKNSQEKDENSTSTKIIYVDLSCGCKTHDEYLLAKP